MFIFAMNALQTREKYITRLKRFFDFIDLPGSKESDLLADPVYWETPSFVQIRKKKTKRLSPYSETEIWDREEVLCIVKYEK